MLLEWGNKFGIECGWWVKRVWGVWDREYTASWQFMLLRPIIKSQPAHKAIWIHRWRWNGVLQETSNRSVLYKLCGVCFFLTEETRLRGEMRWEERNFRFHFGIARWSKMEMTKKGDCKAGNKFIQAQGIRIILTNTSLADEMNSSSWTSWDFSILPFKPAQSW